MPSFYHVTTPDSPVVELLTREGLSRVTSGSVATLAHAYCKMRKKLYPNDPSKWIYIQRPMMRKFQLLP